MAFLAGENPRRALVQAPVGFGKTIIIAELCSRLIQAGRARKILIVTDLRWDAVAIYDALRRYHPAGDRGRPGGPLHVGQYVGGASAPGNVMVATSQRLLSHAKAQEQGDRASLIDDEILDGIDLVLVYEAHRTTQSALVEFSDKIAAPLIAFGISADKRTLDLFGGEPLWKQSFEQAILEGYNLPPRIYRLTSAPETAAGSAGPRARIHEVVTEFRDKLFSEAFPDRTMVPKTLIFAMSDAHANAVVEACQQVFEETQDFAVKITAHLTNPYEVLDRFRTERGPRIAVSVDMLASGVDMPAVECLVFLRPIRSELLYQQMLGRGTRRIDSDSLQAVTPDAREKTFFAVFDAVGVTAEGHFATADRIPRQDHHRLTTRRFRLSDLLTGGVLSVGAYLRFKSRRTGSVTTAVVRDDGSLDLLDGRVFLSPSAAASAVAGYPVNGWTAWVTEEEDAPLDQLRQTMLSAAVDDLDKLGQESATLRKATDAEESGSSDGSDSEAGSETEERVRCLAELRRLRRDADAGKPHTLSVREFIALWGARGRDAHLIEIIETDLSNHGLVTVPDFRLITMEDQVTVGLSADAATSPSDAAEPDAVDTPLTAATGTTRITERTKPSKIRQRPERGLVVGNLPSASLGVESVKPAATIEQAITTMLLHDYSQLAVMSGQRNLSGAVTWKSIAKARHQKRDAPLSAAVIPAVEVSYAEDLIDALPKITAHDFVFVRGPHNTISGIVTASDVVQTYGVMTSPFFIIGEIDQILRWILEDAIDIEQVQVLCDADGTRQIDGFSRLTMGDYQRVLENPEAWAALGWPLDRRVFSQWLRRICEMRNNIMHFNGDPLPDDMVTMLKNFLSLLREYCP
ncbi:Helicase conserved C-terminal domain-containing protein [Micromonospora cremea]|uniref:Helicase conserved C-terminal domain-containing protein n=2 Tax=Micromonospora cremea TaxID=709881 RepID=A0A1N5TYW6_9ACTN|nr:Helicase conserved C-terminal domain-containing protein [Micromonospora cremea]